MIQDSFRKAKSVASLNSDLISVPLELQAAKESGNVQIAVLLIIAILKQG